MKSIFISLFLLVPSALLAQQPAAELEQRLTTASDRVAQARTGDDQPVLIHALEDLSQAQLGLGDSNSALASLRESLKLARAIGEQPAIARCLLGIGQIHFRAGRMPAAAETLRRAVAAAEATGPDQLIHEASKSLSQASAAVGQFQQAYQATRRAAELETSLTSQRHAEAIAELEARQAAELETLQAEAPPQDPREQPAEVAGQRDRSGQLPGLALAGGIAVPLLLLSLLGHWWFRRRTRQTLAESDAALSRMQDDLQRTSDERDQLSTWRDQAAGEYDRLSAELGDSDDERQRLSTELDQTSAELAQTSAKLERTAEQLEQTFIELKQTSSDRDRAIGELASSASERDRHAAALEHTAAQVEQGSAELQQMTDERDRHAAQLEHTTAEAERISDALMQASAQYEKTAGERDRLTDQLARTSDELEQLRNDCRQDISAMADRNAVARERLVEMERFNSTLSQHLKILLVGVRSSLGALQQDASAGDVEQLQKDVGRTHLAVGKTVRLLDELQKLLLVGRVVHTPEAASMSELAYEAAGQAEGLADRRVEVVIAPAMPAVYGDRSQLLEVLRRLLENGGKFMGAQPSPRLQVGHRRDWPRADTAEDVFFVRDNGIGIETHDQERVFALFEKLDPDSEGLGIGLPLVKRIVEAHGGRVWVESDGIGRGSAFCFSLSRKYAAPPAATPSAAPA